MIKKYKLDYLLRVPIRGGGWHESRSHRTVPGYCAPDAVARLRKSLSEKWTDGPQVVIEGGIIIQPDGNCVPLNPDILPTL